MPSATPTFIDVIDLGRLPSGVPYLMMEFLDGETLSARIRRDGRLAVAAALDVAIQAASSGRIGFVLDVPDVVEADELPGRSL